jgi:demethylmenaquinone methyltransferase/2-methoxy-6-polyprenyl-1,4-benzoquinol methylase
MNERSRKAGYDLFSGIYDIMDRIYFPEISSNPRFNLISRIDNTGLNILDVCIGTGTTSVMLAGKNPRNLITGIDISAGMMRRAEKKIHRMKAENIRLLAMDAQKMSFADNEFDIATISLALHEMPRKTMHAVLQEIRRVLKPGGTLLIIEWQKPSAGFGRKVNFKILEFLEPAGFGEFLNTDWGLLLNEFGFTLDSITPCSYTQLIQARATAPGPRR